MTKFQKQNFFQNTNESYELLPFRFARINGRVLLTNLVGEYFFTKDEVLKSLVDGTLPNDSDDYLNLRSLHFICDDQTQSAIQLLGIKTALNEFVAYINLADTSTYELGDKSRLIMLYALCGFANFSSVGILLSGMSAMIPERRMDLISVSGKALWAALLASCMTGFMVGIFHT